MCGDQIVPDMSVSTPGIPDKPAGKGGCDFAASATSPATVWLFAAVLVSLFVRRRRRI
jgi:MYXO-CTERM domain-containing protein